METEIKEQLIKSVNNIKNKIKQIQNEEDIANLKFKKVFKPITDNLRTIIKSNDKDKPALNVSIDMSTTKSTEEDFNLSSDYDDFSKNIDADSSGKSEYFEYANDSKSPRKDLDDTLRSLNKEEIINIYDSNINVPFGIRTQNKKLMMGNCEVSISARGNASNSNKLYVIRIGDRDFEFTPGLKELLIRSKPNLKTVNEKDKITYKDILTYTNAHKRKFSPYGQIKGDKGLKYCKIIKPLFSSETKLKTGGYIPICKKYKSDTDYVYWDDPNELIERLKLLIASQSAGNTNHDNEILSIIEELKESGIIL